MSAGPTPGDVLIATYADRHFVSLVPERPHLSFKSLSQAREFAQRWKRDHSGVSVWHQIDGETHLMSLAENPKPAHLESKAG